MKWNQWKPLIYGVVIFISGIQAGRMLYQEPQPGSLKGDPPYCMSNAWVEKVDGDWLLTLENVYLEHRPHGGIPLYSFHIVWEKLARGDVELVSHSPNLDGWDLRFGERDTGSLTFGGTGFALPPGATATLRFRIDSLEMAKAFPAKVYTESSPAKLADARRDSRTGLTELDGYHTPAPAKIAADLQAAKVLSVLDFGMLYDGGSQAIGLEGLPYRVDLIARVGFDQTEPVRIDVFPEGAWVKGGLEIPHQSVLEEQVLRLLEEAIQRENRHNTRKMLTVMVDTIRTRRFPEPDAWPGLGEKATSVELPPSVIDLQAEIEPSPLEFKLPPKPQVTFAN